MSAEYIFTFIYRWIEQNEHVLQKEIRQKLEFSLRKLHYLSMLVEGDVQTAILYARSHFAPFSRDYLKGKLNASLSSRHLLIL
jgi:hypothetical protein